MAGQPPLITVTDLSHSFPVQGAEPVAALSGINLALHPGEMVAVVGANGSGKTTLGRHLNGLLLPDSGCVTVDGMDTRTRADLPCIRSSVAMVFQRPEDQIVATTVEDDVAFGPQNLGLPGDQIESRVRWALETTGMWEQRFRPPHLLSAGQQQRVAIAGALAMRPRCMVLDEATAMLDPAGRRAVLDLLSQLHREGMTIVHITHSMREACGAERVIVLADGRVAWDGPPAALFRDPDRLEPLGLEAPPAVALYQELARRYPGLPGGLLTEAEVAEQLLGRLARRSASDEPASEEPPAETGRPALSVSAVEHTYLEGTPFATRSLEKLDLTLYAGEPAALLGPTGSGKSTLLQLMAGLLEPQAGKVVLDSHQPVSSGSRSVAMLFQRPEEQLFETFVGDDVAYGPRQMGLPADEVRRRVRWAMDLGNIPFDHYKDRFCQGISGGEQRKAALAGVLAVRPHILLLDEPTAGLDPRTRREVLETLRQMVQDEGMTLMMATHQMEDVAELAQRAWVLDRGRLLATGTPRALFQRPDLMAQHGLEVPEVTSFFTDCGRKARMSRAID
jgi:energy-coupling factor transport system ATP-binding protein